MRKPSGLKALPLFERALAITETALGPDHPDTLASAGALADCQWRLELDGRLVTDEGLLPASL